ncbi:MAG: hypothetical protein K2P04_09820 [Oscillospiraceae bacterium]|nr:hypothetical protein [Oscillospiraceae bacterium]MDE6998153.1 hypothetical protein [Oscillospiraceae bacterium]
MCALCSNTSSLSRIRYCVLTCRGAHYAPYKMTAFLTVLAVMR